MVLYRSFVRYFLPLLCALFLEATAGSEEPDGGGLTAAIEAYLSDSKASEGRHGSAQGLYRPDPAHYAVLLALPGEQAAPPAAKPKAVETKASEKPEDKNAYRMRTQTIYGSRKAVSLRGTSGSHLGPEDIQELNLDDINRALRRVPGVYPREEDGYGLFPNISLRGVDTTRSAKVTVMEDGVLTAPAPYSAPAAYYSPTLGRMHAIDILKGSSQVLYGPHITGGAINYVSTPIPGESAAYLKVLYGSYNEIRAHAWYGTVLPTRNGTWSFLVEGYFRETDGFKVIGRTPDLTGALADQTGFTKGDVLLKVAYEPNSEVYQKFLLSVGTTDLDADETYLGLSEPDIRRTPNLRYSASRFDNIKSTHDRTYLRWLIVPGDRTEVETTVYYNRFERDWYKLHDLRNIEDSTDPTGTVNQTLSNALAGGNGGFGLDVLKGQRAGTLRVRSNNREYYLWGVQSVVTHHIPGAVEHEITGTIRYHEDQARRFQRDDLYQQEDNGTISDVTVGAPGGAGNRKQKTNALALAVQDAIHSGEWTFTPGIRVEFLDLMHEDFDNPANSGSQNLTLVAGGFSVLYDPEGDWSFFTGLFSGFSPPSPRAAVKDGLAEETSLAFELGTRLQRADGIWAFTTVFFYTGFDDLIVIDNIGGAGSGDSENVGKVQSLGIELTVDYDVGRALNLNYGALVFLTFTWTDATLDGDSNSTDPESIFAGGLDGNRVPYIPEFQLMVGVTITVRKFGLTLSGSFVDRTFTTASNTTDQLTPAGVPDSRFGTTDSYFVIDFSLYYELKPGVRVLGGIQNVLDDEYIASRHPHGPRPGKPFFAYIGMEFRF